MNNPTIVIADSSGLISLLSQTDRNHAEAVRVSKRFFGLFRILKAFVQLFPVNSNKSVIALGLFDFRSRSVIP